MTVIKNNRILKCLLIMVVSLLLVLNFSIGVSASTNYDRQEADAYITIHEFCIVLYYKIRPTHHALSRACADGLAAWAPYALTDSQADIPPGWSLQKHRISQPDRQRKVL